MAISGLARITRRCYFWSRFWVLNISAFLEMTLLTFHCYKDKMLWGILFHYFLQIFESTIEISAKKASKWYQRDHLKKKFKHFSHLFSNWKKLDNSFVHICGWSLYDKSPSIILNLGHINFQDLKMSERTIPRGFCDLGIYFPTSSQSGQHSSVSPASLSTLSALA